MAKYLQNSADIEINESGDNISLSIIKSAVYSELFPIGKVVIFEDNEDHSNYLGFTWERTCIGRTPVGIDTTQTEFNSIGKTGGEKTHTLTINEMPSHNHKVDAGVSLNAANVAYTAITGNLDYADTGASSIKNTGGNQPHNNLQPYIVESFWKRVA